MEEFKAELAKPKPNSVINSYRSFGYSLSTAIADIIDNSISAKATVINISYEWNGAESTLTISDNGSGMSLADLVIAMTPGSKNPDDEREKHDLGRFGLGLKTASFSQCKRLTVVSKKNYELNKRCWDIDFVNSSEEWFLLDYISDQRYTRSLSDLESGTIVIWEKLDRVVGTANRDNEAVKSAFYNEFKNVKDHLALVFHRFIESNRITIFINDVEVQPTNPFLLDIEPKPEMGHTEILEGNVEACYYILPHMSRLAHEDYMKTGGPLGWYKEQGFYIYREDRLVIGGDWLGLEKKREYSKLARISVTFFNTGDFDWKIDIKKSIAMPPIALRKDLTRIAKAACMRSAQIYNWRGQKTLGEARGNHTIQKLWNEETTNEGVRKYKINRSHFIIKQVLEGRASSKMVSKMVGLIEDNIPIELILYNQNEDPSLHELEKITEVPSDALINLAVELYKMNVQQDVPKDLAAQQIMSSAPFYLYPLIKEYLK